MFRDYNAIQTIAPLFRFGILYTRQVVLSPYKVAIVVGWYPNPRLRILGTARSHRAVILG